MTNPKNPDDNNENLDNLLTAGEAADYLAKRWGRDRYDAKAFKLLRHRWNLQPAMTLPNATLWRRSDLDKIPEPDRSRPRPSAKGPRKKKNPDESVDNAEYSMLSLA